MKIKKDKIRVAIIGGGPSGLFMYKRCIEEAHTHFEIHIFERKTELGAGMPYSALGANNEHITNVSDNEIPAIVTHIKDWVYEAPRDLLKTFEIDPDKFNEYKVLPRLFFGRYLADQFDLLQLKAKEAGITTCIHLNCKVTDIEDEPGKQQVLVITQTNETFTFDHVIISTGHNWPVQHEGKVPGYYDSPYPPAKLALKLNHPVALRGSSLTAIDAIRTLARHNGTFEKTGNGMLSFKLAEGSEGFKIVMHSKNGLLPAIRFHLEDSHLSNDSLLTPAQIKEHMRENGGFLSLDFIFEKDFKDIFRGKDPSFYVLIKDMSLEQFVDRMMGLRERLDPFVLFKAEYKEAERSIKRHESVYWKEMLAVLSFAMNYPAKHFSAEDTLRLHKELLPLISIVIAFVPQSSCKELMALHDAGLLSLVAVGTVNEIKAEPEGGITYTFTDHEHHIQHTYYKTFIDCVGQRHLSYKDFPFKSLHAQRTISPARIPFRYAAEGEQAMAEGNDDVEKDKDGNYYLSVPGITINDDFEIIDPAGASNERLFIMAIPYISGYNPDYSGLDFCEAASSRIIKRIVGK